MAKLPRRLRLQTRKTNAVAERPAGWSLVGKPVDPRQAGLFDAPLSKRIKPCLPTLVGTPPTAPEWAHEIEWDGYRVSAYIEDCKATIRIRNSHDGALSDDRPRRRDAATPRR